MAVFRISHNITSKLEGGYANNPKDNGGETYAGISRKYFPYWIGWQFIDRQAHPIRNNTRFTNLNGAVEIFYTREFWDKLHCSKLEQSLANQLFDYAVNSGKGQAVKDLQRVLNGLGEALKVDGALGSKTLAAIGRHKQNELANHLHNMRTRFLVEESKDQPDFAAVWSSRLDTMKKHLPSVGVSFGLIAAIGLSLFFLTKN
ncbi:hypothetical protein L3049_14085 [Labilibaculum sp. DW002]|uniref:Secretion activator protein n=1 Tax=Paralabilibaculum antarcticum TaxID=2912572 RepID=A0ABT5VUM4_9BACT|nr:glycosyl hydrolase 108 family protein [Labilibaculum sp. DW002]MDE5419125.1 hypothetical protein [Labilibaculum sp. DW002]